MLQSSGSAIIVLPAETLWPRHSRHKTSASYWPLSSHFSLSLAETKPRSAQARPADLPKLETRLAQLTHLLTLMTCPRCLILSADHCPVPMISVSLNTQFPHPHGHRLEECPVSPENAQTRDKICAIRLELREVYTFTLKR